MTFNSPTSDYNFPINTQSPETLIVSSRYTKQQLDFLKETIKIEIALAKKTLFDHIIAEFGSSEFTSDIDSYKGKPLGYIIPFEPGNNAIKDAILTLVGEDKQIQDELRKIFSQNSPLNINISIVKESNAPQITSIGINDKTPYTIVN